MHTNKPTNKGTFIHFMCLTLHLPSNRPQTNNAKNKTSSTE